MQIRKCRRDNKTKPTYQKTLIRNDILKFTGDCSDYFFERVPQAFANLNTYHTQYISLSSSQVYHVLLDFYCFRFSKHSICENLPQDN